MMLTNDQIWHLRKQVADAGDWTAKDVQDLPIADLLDLYKQVLLEAGRPLRLPAEDGATVESAYGVYPELEEEAETEK